MLLPFWAYCIDTERCRVKRFNNYISVYENYVLEMEKNKLIVYDTKDDSKYEWILDENISRVLGNYAFCSLTKNILKINFITKTLESFYCLEKGERIQYDRHKFVVIGNGYIKILENDIFYRITHPHRYAFSKIIQEGIVCFVGCKNLLIDYINDEVIQETFYEVLYYHDDIFIIQLWCPDSYMYKHYMLYNSELTEIVKCDVYYEGRGYRLLHMDELSVHDYYTPLPPK